MSVSCVLGVLGLVRMRFRALCGRVEVPGAGACVFWLAFLGVCCMCAGGGCCLGMGYFLVRVYAMLAPSGVSAAAVAVVGAEVAVWPSVVLVRAGAECCGLAGWGWIQGRRREQS